MLSKDDCKKLSQLIGAAKRSKATLLSVAGQIDNIGSRYPGTSVESLIHAGIKSLFQAKYWADQAVDVFELIVKRSRGKGGRA
jgi:hypothetical protein